MARERDSAGGPIRRDHLRIGVLGCGSIAWRRALPAFRAHPRTAVVAVASRDGDKARRYAERFGGEPVHGYQELLDRDDVDAVYVALPTGLHHTWVAAALRAGKHVLAEKPLTTSAEATAELAALADRQRLLLRENVMFLHHAQHGVVRDLVRSGRLGEIRGFTGAFCVPPFADTDIRYAAELGGGALHDLAVYPLRAARLLLGTGLEVVGAWLREDPGRGVDVSGSVLLASADGVPATVHFGFEHAYGAEYALWGSTARLVLERAYTPPPEWRPVLRITEQDRTEELVLAADDQFHNAVAAFADAVLAGRTGLDDAGTRDTAELVDAIRRVAKRARAGQPRGTAAWR